MLGHSTYPYTEQMASTTQRYSGTSSAFSASANPNEDWTKISDLAERRRIQNRIAQRNYRKKLKKRLEDLERRAASNSASPEQRPAELHWTAADSGSAADASPDLKEAAAAAAASAVADQSGRSSRGSQNSHPSQHSQHPQAQPQSSQFYPTAEDRVMFSQQYTRQLSTSPPPFTYSSYQPEPITYASFAQSVYQPLSGAAATEQSLFAPYLPPLGHNSSTYPPTLPGIGYPAKQEFYAEEEMSPFSMSYASMAGIDIPSAQAYHDNAQMHTPPLSESFEHSIAGSPPELYYPTTPASMPGTPPLRLI